MSKRFTDTDKWRKSWYRLLTPKQKCFFNYLCDNCDQAGVWEPDFDLASFIIGESVSNNDIEKFGDRVVLLESGKYWIRNFVLFQFGTLSKECRAHTPVLACIRKHGLPYTNGDTHVDTHVDTLSQPLSPPLQEKEEVQEKEPEKEKEKKKGESEGETALRLRIGSWFHRRAGTVWSEKETEQFREVYKAHSADDVALLEAYYTAKITNRDIRRLDIITLLNNWNGEVDRARNWGRSVAEKHTSLL